MSRALIRRRGKLRAQGGTASLWPAAGQVPPILARGAPRWLRGGEPLTLTWPGRRPEREQL
jgi:hypothetical protein